jgi:epidermal growth factor receptor substrate 15
VSELLNNSNPSHAIEEEITSLEPLGLNEFLLPSSPLGQATLQLQFLHPLGATSIAGLENWNLPSSEGLEDNSSELMFQEHPFFNSLVSDGITQPVSPSSVSVQINSSNISTSSIPSPSSAPLEVTSTDTSSTSELSPTSLPLQRQTDNSEEIPETVEITPQITQAVPTESPTISTSSIPSPSSAPLEVTSIDTSCTSELSPTFLPLQRQTDNSEEIPETAEITSQITQDVPTESPTVSTSSIPSPSSAPLEVTSIDTSSTAELSPTSLPLQRQTDGSEKTPEEENQPTLEELVSTETVVTQANLPIESSPAAQSELDPVNSETTKNNLQTQPISAVSPSPKATPLDESAFLQPRLETDTSTETSTPLTETPTQSQPPKFTLPASDAIAHSSTLESNLSPTPKITTQTNLTKTDYPSLLLDIGESETPIQSKLEPSPTIHETTSVEKPTLAAQLPTPSESAEVKLQLKSTTLENTETTIKDRASITPDTTNNTNETELTEFVSSPTPTPEALPESKPAITETEIGTDSNITVAQLLKDGNHTPLIPTVIENLAQKDSIRPANPLGQSSQDMRIWGNQKKYLQSSNNQSPINTSLPPVIQKKTEKSERSSPPHSFPPNSTNNNDLESQSTHQIINQVIPDSWSSLADLIGDTAPSIQRTSEQQFSPSQDKNIAVNSSHDKPEESHQNHIINRSKSNLKHHSFIQTKPENNNLKPALAKSNFTTPLQREDEDELETLLEDNSDSLEILAREIYHSIRQRLEIERERRGNYSSLRFPW